MLCSCLTSFFSFILWKESLHDVINPFLHTLPVNEHNKHGGLAASTDVRRRSVCVCVCVYQESSRNTLQQLISQICMHSWWSNTMGHQILIFSVRNVCVCVLVKTLNIIFFIVCGFYFIYECSVKAQCVLATLRKHHWKGGLIDYVGKLIFLETNDSLVYGLAFLAAVSLQL